MNYLNRTKVIFILILISYRFYGQTTDSINHGEFNKYLERIDGYMTLKLSHSTDLETFSVDTETNDFALAPNARSESRLHFNYEFISFSFKYIPTFLPGNDDDDIKGKTKGNGFGLNLNFNRWLQEFSYNKTQGYYLENTGDYDPNWQKGDPYIQLPELVYKNYQGITAYKFNPNFSFKAIATQTERQLKSTGSFIPHLLYRYYIIDNQQEITTTNSTQKSDNYEFVLGIGYYYTFVFMEDFNISMGLTPGTGYLYSTIKTRSQVENLKTAQDNFVLRFDGRAGVGYNGKRFFAGIFTKLSTNSYTQ